MRKGRSPAEIRSTLDRLYSRYGGRRLDSDPVSLAHRFRTRRDIELTALLASLLAFGRADLIIRSVKEILEILGDSPSVYLRHATGRKIIADFKGFQYRFVRGSDVAALLISLKACLEEYGGIGPFLKDGSRRDLPALTGRHPLRDERVWRLTLLLREELYRRGLKAAEKQRLQLTRGFAHLLADPLKSSACKRWFLFCRWMVRKDAIDFGLWKFVKPRELLASVDTHIARIGFLIGLTGRKSVGPVMVKEITENLRQINPKDPLKYDFALTRLGILRECVGKNKNELCVKCPLRNLCVIFAR